MLARDSPFLSSHPPNYSLTVNCTISHKKSPGTGPKFLFQATTPNTQVKFHTQLCEENGCRQRNFKFQFSSTKFIQFRQTLPSRSTSNGTALNETTFPWIFTVIYSQFLEISQRLTRRTERTPAGKSDTNEARRTQTTKPEPARKRESAMTGGIDGEVFQRTVLPVGMDMVV